MNLWIRSQNGESLIIANDLHIDTTIYKKKTAIINSRTSTDCCILGTYLTKERAMEILNEIQELICPRPRFIFSQHIDFENKEEGLIGIATYKEEPKIEKLTNDVLYQMPKE